MGTLKSFMIRYIVRLLNSPNAIVYLVISGEENSKTKCDTILPNQGYTDKYTLVHGDTATRSGYTVQQVLHKLKSLQQDQAVLVSTQEEDDVPSAGQIEEIRSSSNGRKVEILSSYIEFY